MYLYSMYSGELLKGTLSAIVLKLLHENQKMYGYQITQKVKELSKNKILIKGAIEIDQGYIPENGFAAKLFSMMSVEIDSQTVSKNYNKYGIIYERYLEIILEVNFFLLTTSTKSGISIHPCLLLLCHMKDTLIISIPIKLKYLKSQVLT